MLSRPLGGPHRVRGGVRLGPGDPPLHLLLLPHLGVRLHLAQCPHASPGSQTLQLRHGHVEEGKVY